MGARNGTAASKQALSQIRREDHVSYLALGNGIIPVAYSTLPPKQAGRRWATMRVGGGQPNLFSMEQKMHGNEMFLINLHRNPTQRTPSSLQYSPYRSCNETGGSMTSNFLQLYPFRYTTALLAKKKSMSPTFTHTRVPVFYYDATQCCEQSAVLNCASNV